MSAVRLLFVGALLTAGVAILLAVTGGRFGGVVVVGCVAVALAVAALVVRDRTRLATWERDQQGRCRSCGYRLSGQARCPECGAEYRTDD